MSSTVSIAELQKRGVALRPHEVVAIAQSLIHRSESSVDLSPSGPLTPETVELYEDGSVGVLQSVAPPTVSEVALFLQTLLPEDASLVPADLCHTIRRALLESDRRAYESVEDFSRALEPYELGERDEVVRSLLDRPLNARVVVLPLRREEGRRIRAVAPRQGIAERIVRLPAAHVIERRRTGPRVDELRRELRAADMRRFEQRMRSLPVVVRARPMFWRIPAIAASLAVAALWIGAAQFVFLRRDAPATAQPLTGRPLAVQPRAVQSAEDRPATMRPIATAIQANGADMRLATPSIATRPRSSAWRREAATGLINDAVSQTPAEPPDTDESGMIVPALDVNHRPIFSSAFASDASPIFGSDLRVMRIVDRGARNYHVQPSPDGRQIAFDSDRDGEWGVYVADRDGTNVRRVSGDGYAAVPKWAPDGKRLTFVRADPSDPKVWNLWLLVLENRDMRPLTDYRSGQVWSASWFPDGRRICYAHEDRVIILDLASGQSRAFATPVEGRTVRTPVVSPDGSKVIFQVSRNGAWLLDLADASMRCVLTDPTAEDFAWAPDGRRVAFHSRRDGEWGIYVMGG